MRDGKWVWKKGDRAQVRRLTRQGTGERQIGKIFDVQWVKHFYGKTELLIWGRDDWNTARGHFAYRCVPVIRVPARYRESV